MVKIAEQGTCIVDLAHQGNYLVYELWTVEMHYLEQVQETPVLHKLWVDVKELGHADSGCLAHVWVIILQRCNALLHFCQGQSKYKVEVMQPVYI